MTLAEILSSLFPEGAPAATAKQAPGLPTMLGAAGQPGLVGGPSGPAQAPIRSPNNSSIATQPRPPRETEASSIAGGPASSNVKDFTGQGSPYQAPPAMDPITTGSVLRGEPSPKAAAQYPMMLPQAKGPGFADAVGSFFAGLSGPEALAAHHARGDRERSREQASLDQNQTFQALIGKGVDEATARAAVANPEVLKAVLPNVFGGGQTDDWREYQLAKKEGFGGGFIDFKQQTKRTNQLQRVDLGDSWGFADPTTGAIVQTVQKNLAEASRQRKYGTETGSAQAALPDAEATAKTTLEQIDSILLDPQLNSSVGPLDGKLMNISGGAHRFQSKMDQIKGQAFLQAFQSLKGGGAITEVEGQKATQAIARLNEAQNEGDFKSALGELKMITERALTKARTKASGDFTGASTNGNGPASTNGGWGIRRAN